jgi:hypothetical protein
VLMTAKGWAILAFGNRRSSWTGGISYTSFSL